MTSSNGEEKQWPPDAKLLDQFEASYKEPGGFIQPFGCLMVVKESSFEIIAHSENAMNLLGINGDTLLGSDARILFTSSSSQCLMAAVVARDISNPVMVTSNRVKRGFYAILHKVDVGFLIELEPILNWSPVFTDYAAIKAQNFAISAFSDMQTNSPGNISALCDSMAKVVKDLTKYDRVMVYKFHQDEHGEVVSDIERPDLESYLGLHCSATDIPHLLLQNPVMMMICDVSATPVPIIQNQNLDSPLILGNSTLRAPHGCLAQYMVNMNSKGSLVMAIVVNENNKTKLWGLVVCNHVGPHYLPYLIRCVCELMIQAFGSQLSLELPRAKHKAERKILKTQAELRDMLFRDIPYGIVSSSPNIMDLVQCDGAAFYYGGVCRVLGTTPSELQINDLRDWLFAYEKDFSVWHTDSLLDIGCPFASELNSICGIAAAHITSKDVIFWFRMATGTEIKWGDTKHHPTDKDDGDLTHPRSSFKPFLEVVKDKSFSWKTWEINAIHSLRDKVVKCLCLQASERERLERLFETARVPVFAVDAIGFVTKWNSRISYLTGLQASEVVGKLAVNEVIHNDSRQKFERHLYCSSKGQDDTNIELRLRNLKQGEENTPIFIVANASSIRDCAKNVLCVWFVAQDVTKEKITRDKLARVETDYQALTQHPALPPMFFSDKNARCSEWNVGMTNLTGWNRSEVVGKMLPGEIFGELIKLKSQNGAAKLMIYFCEILCGNDPEALCNTDHQIEPFGFYNREGMYTDALLSVEKKVDMNGEVVGCLCFLKPTSENVASASTSRQPIEAMEVNVASASTSRQPIEAMEANVASASTSRQPIASASTSRQPIEAMEANVASASTGRQPIEAMEAE